jgi:parallel beta-helix repeat protein
MKKILYALGVLLLAVAAVFIVRSYWEKETIALIDQYYQQHKSAAGYVYYVSPSGSDGNAGTLASPWRSINTAVANLKAGDTLYVRGGTYVEVININVSGTAAAPINITSYPNEFPVIDGQNKIPTNDWAALVSIGGNYINMSGFEVKNSFAYYSRGVNISGAHNTVSKFNVHHIQDNGMLIQGDYNIIEDSKVWQTCYNNVNNQRNGWASALTGARGNSATIIPKITSYPILRRNTVFNNWGEGLSCYEADHCIIEDNIAYDNLSVELYLSDATNSLVQRNLVYRTPNPIVPYQNSGGFTLADETLVRPSSNNTIINNLVYNTQFLAFSWTIPPNTGLKNVLIANNTLVNTSFNTNSGGNQNITNINTRIINNIFNSSSNQVPSNSGITFSNNNWSVTPPSAAASSTNIIADPQLARTGATTAGTLSPNYFKLAASSPLIGAGIMLQEVTDDYFKNLRTGAKTDIGAYVLQTPGVDSTAPSTSTGLNASATSSTQVNLAWNASTDNVGVTGYKIYRNGSQIGTSTVASLIDTNTVGGTTYNYTVIAFDLAGNASASSNTATVTTPAAIVPVSITSYNAGSITATSAQINWTTNLPSTGVVSYGNSAANLSTTVNANNLSTNQSIQITGLASGTPYYYKISAGDFSVNSNFSTLVAVTQKSATNIAPLASVTASSQNTGTNQQAVKAIDKLIDGYPGDYTREWATIAQKAGAWIQLKWSKSYTVNQVVLFDRPNTNDQITSATLTFSNGSTVKVGSLNNTGGAVIINFPAVVTTSIKVTVKTVSGSTTNIGLSELQVYGF